MEEEMDSTASDSRVGMIVKSLDPNNCISPYQPNEYLGGDAECTSSKFKGVVSLKNGKWGAQICVNRKSYWLGTYQVVEEAAMAYDRAVIKIQRGNHYLNFPWTDLTSKEAVFLGLYSTCEVFKMIKDKSFASKFANFITIQSSIIRNGAHDLMNEAGILHQHLFQLDLTLRDITNLRRFIIPNEYGSKYFPPLVGSIFSERDDGRGKVNPTLLTFYDRYHRMWTFQYSYWKHIQSFVFTTGWKDFVLWHRLKENDIVSFYRCEYAEEVGERMFYLINIDYKNGENGEKVICLEGDNNIELEINGKGEEEMNKGFKLFGVQIS